jgi:hypothetical protein
MNKSHLPKKKKKEQKKKQKSKKNQIESFKLFLQIFTAIAVVILGILDFSVLHLPLSRMELFSNILKATEIIIPKGQLTLDENKIKLRDGKELTMIFNLKNSGEYTFFASEPKITIQQYEEGKLHPIPEKFYSVQFAIPGRCAPKIETVCGIVITFRDFTIPKILFVSYALSIETEDTIVKIVKQLIENSGKKTKNILKDKIIKNLSKTQLEYNSYLHIHISN